MDQTEISDVYFRRLVIPIIITILIMCGIAVIIATPPGTPVTWNSYSSVFGLNQIAGAFRR